MNKNLDRKAYYRDSKRLFEQGDNPKAIIKCSRAACLNPHHSSTYVNWGLSIFGPQDFKKADRKFARAILIDPKNYRAFYNYGGAHYHSGNFEKAALYLGKACSLTSRPKYKYIQYWGMALLHQGKYDEAVLRCNEMVSRDPKAPFSFLCCAMICHCQNRHEEAAMLFEKALVIFNPTQTKTQIVTFILNDLKLTEQTIKDEKNTQYKEQHRKIESVIRFYLNKIRSQWPE